MKPNPKINGPIHTDFKTIRNVVSSAIEAKTCENFSNVKIYIGIQPSLITLDHKQPATHLKTYNYTTEGLVNSGKKPKRSKIWYMK